MDRLDAMKLFVRVVETGSFSRAAKEFATTQPTVTKQIAALEHHLKVRLLNRNSRGVSVTSAGAAYCERCKVIVREVQEADDLVRPARGSGKHKVQLSGSMRVSTSVAFGRRVLVPLALKFMAQHPQLSLDLSFEDRYTDLVAQGIDVAVRMGSLADSSLGARDLGFNPWMMVASPDYLLAHGTPVQAGDLAAHAALVYSSVQGDDVWRILSPSGTAVSVTVKGPLRSNNLSAVLAAARAGLGIAALPCYVAMESIVAGKVIEVMADWRLPSQEIHAVFPSPKLVPPKVMAFSAFLKEHLGADWWVRLPRV